MNIGSKVKVRMDAEREVEATVLDFREKYVVVAGAEELRRAGADGRKPVGLCFKRHLVKVVEWCG
jgi:hypothetical protein